MACSRWPVACGVCSLLSTFNSSTALAAQRAASYELSSSPFCTVIGISPPAPSWKSKRIFRHKGHEGSEVGCQLSAVSLMPQTFDQPSARNAISPICHPSAAVAEGAAPVGEVGHDGDGDEDHPADGQVVAGVDHAGRAGQRSCRAGRVIPEAACGGFVSRTAPGLIPGCTRSEAAKPAGPLAASDFSSSWEQSQALTKPPKQSR